MKKSNFTALLLGTIGAMFVGMGMCMCLLPEWNAMKQGIFVGAIGFGVLLITWIIWRKMEHKAPIKISGKVIATCILAISGVLLLGGGMCLTMLWGKFIFGIILGVVGIFVLMMLIPFTKGLK